MAGDDTKDTKSTKTESPTASPSVKVATKSAKKDATTMPTFTAINVVDTMVTEDGGTLSTSVCETSTTTTQPAQDFGFEFAVCYQNPDSVVDPAPLLQGLEHDMVDSFLRKPSCQVPSTSLATSCPAVASLYFPSTNTEVSVNGDNGGVKCQAQTNSGDDDDDAHPCYTCHTHFQLTCATEAVRRGRQFRLLSSSSSSSKEDNNDSKKNDKAGRRGLVGTQQDDKADSELQEALATYLTNYFEQALVQQQEEQDDNSGGGRISFLEFTGFVEEEDNGNDAMSLAPTASPMIVAGNNSKDDTTTETDAVRQTNQPATDSGGGGAIGIVIVLAVLAALAFYVVKRGRNNAQKIQDRNAKQQRECDEFHHQTDEDSSEDEEDHSNAIAKHHHERALKMTGSQQPSVVATLVEPVEEADADADPQQQQSQEAVYDHKGTVVTALAVEPLYQQQQQQQGDIDIDDDDVMAKKKTTGGDDGGTDGGTAGAATAAYSSWIGGGFDTDAACGAGTMDFTTTTTKTAAEIGSMPSRQPPGNPFSAW
eukprot:CAMPEP_0168748278 /NCGR_PEP_ID=MMETSP0724-20121128/16093_1 /TAXON_ID=265536 /ORGANISM="Amphiprora sp., Strain CCMP467" /LENGTH=536 /DNA_ID=CAMNT_0008796101 /DNA_START=29 /DNA_END=1639 /DNA_ORIENTATION=+